MKKINLDYLFDSPQQYLKKLGITQKIETAVNDKFEAEGITEHINDTVNERLNDPAFAETVSDLAAEYTDATLAAIDYSTIVNPLIDTKITSNNTTQQSTVDSKISSNNTTQQGVMDSKISTNNTAQQAIVDTKISTSGSALTASINASLPSTIDTRIAGTSMKIHNDVQDYTAASIPNGYNLSWNTSTSQWEPTAGAAAKGNIRLFVAEKASNSNVFYFNSITVTALSSASTNIDTAFMVTSNLLNTLTIDLRSNQATSNNIRIDLYKNANGAAFSSATTSIANQTQTLTQYNVIRYTFTGLTLNQYDAIHIKVTPTSNPGEVYGIVTIS